MPRPNTNDPHWTFLGAGCNNPHRSRLLKIHEYQAKRFSTGGGIPVPNGVVAKTPEEAAAAATDLGGSIIVKAQVHAGGRGKAGGIKLVATAEEAAAAASELIGSNLVTHQTGPEGVPIRSVLVEERLR